MAAVLIAIRRGVELADPAVLAELVERPVEGDGPETQLAGGEIEDVADDAGAVPIALGEERRMKNQCRRMSEGIRDYTVLYNRDAIPTTDNP
jgi:hypothetical protein